MLSGVIKVFSFQAEFGNQDGPAEEPQRLFQSRLLGGRIKKTS